MPKYKAGHTTTDFQDLCFYAISCIFMYVWTCFNKLLRMFHILLAKYKETSGNARLLHTTVYISFSGVFFADLYVLLVNIFDVAALPGGLHPVCLHSEFIVESTKPGTLAAFFPAPPPPGRPV